MTTTRPDISLTDRVSGGLIGLLIGDALGVPYEFHAASSIPPVAQIEFDPPAGFQRAHVGTPPGTWSDDGAQALCLLASLLHRHGFDPADFGNRLVNWHDHGYLAVDGRVFDVGIQTAESIGFLRAGVPALKAGGDGEYSQGNGSLMRVLPLVLWHQGSDAELVRDAHHQSCPTHSHVTVQACCALYCLWARRLMAGSADAWDESVAILGDIYQAFPKHALALERHILPATGKSPRGSGFVIDSLYSAKQAMDAGPYEAVVRAAIALGNDTDTTACVAGGLAGLRDGVDAIPARWRDRLRGQEDLAPLHRQLLEWVNGA